jgi:hypothetical protein
MRSIWLASYPKSGNTWFRMLVANLGADAAVDINNLPERGGIASARGPFDYLMLVESGLLTMEEVDDLRPLVHAALARGDQDDVHDDPEAVAPVRFVKTHDAYTLTHSGEPMLAGAKGADGAILIVRDPRDVAPSLANHNNTGIDAAITFMNDADQAFCAHRNRQDNQLRQQMLGWSGYARSWLEQRDIPVHLVRYEDMQRDPLGTFAAALQFAGRAATDEDIARAVTLADFGTLKAQEAEKGFREAPRVTTGDTFFRRGEAGAWRDELDAGQVARIEAANAEMMRRLGYTLDG